LSRIDPRTNELTIPPSRKSSEEMLIDKREYSKFEARLA
jgi:hypothetical protein